MDLPNVTLLIQMAHFMVAYYFLKHYVFAPSLKLLVAQQSRVQNLHASISGAMAQKEETILRQKIRWSFIGNSLRKMMPAKLSFLRENVTRPADVGHDEEVILTQQDKKEVRDKIYRDLLGVK